MGLSLEKGLEGRNRFIQPIREGHGIEEMPRIHVNSKIQVVIGIA
jgi:hypothetical protein